MKFPIGWWLAVTGFAVAAASAPADATPSSPLDRMDIREMVEADELSGKGIRVAVLSEAADLDHPLFERSDVVVWRFPSGERLVGSVPENVRPLLLPEEWHGTHVTGILAGSCDHALRGVACGAKTEVYDFGVYGDFFPLAGNAKAGEIEADFLRRMERSFDHARMQGTRIANLSFNVEAPLIPVKNTSQGTSSITQLFENLGILPDFLFANRSKLRASSAIVLAQEQDWADLDQIGANHNDPSALILGLLLPQTREWHQMSDAVARFQAAGGIVIISEANNHLMGRSGVLNTLPLQFEKVLSSHWLSIVHMTEQDGGYAAQLNTCGKEAQRFCMVVDATDILSAVPEDTFSAQSGHSMAAPMVSGLIALMVEKGQRRDANFSAARAMCLMRYSARKDFAGYDPVVHGIGVLDAKAALRLVDGAEGKCNS